MEEEQITLSSVERTAYWWIVTIKSKVRELSIFKCYSKDEEKFISIFKNYTEVEWRILYLKLVEKISKDLDQYIFEGRQSEFNQDTEREGHNLLNKELSSILGKKVPDISLSSDNAKDSVIYTTQTNINKSSIKEYIQGYIPDYKILFIDNMNSIKLNINYHNIN